MYIYHAFGVDSITITNQQFLEISSKENQNKFGFFYNQMQMFASVIAYEKNPFTLRLVNRYINRNIQLSVVCTPKEVSAVTDCGTYSMFCNPKDKLFQKFKKTAQKYGWQEQEVENPILI